MASEALLAANNIADKKVRQDKYAEILEQLIAASDVEGLKCFVEQGACSSFPKILLCFLTETASL